MGQNMTKLFSKVYHMQVMGEINEKLDKTTSHLIVWGKLKVFDEFKELFFLKNSLGT